jgi:hypothetical protein
VSITNNTGSTVADRALGYAGLLGFIADEAHPEAVGVAVERWVAMVEHSDIPREAAFDVLAKVAEYVPFVPLARSCERLGVDFKDVLNV